MPDPIIKDNSKTFNNSGNSKELSELDRLYLSKSEEDLLNFYSHFPTSEELISWMKSRPKAEPNIVHVKGDRGDVAVVIPTISASSEFATECRGIFKSFHIIFVESGESNPFFSFSHNCNVGFKYAIESLSPSWVVYSNDDMFRIDPPDQLFAELKRAESSGSDVLFAGFPSYYHSYVSRFMEPRDEYRIALKIIENTHLIVSRMIGGKMEVRKMLLEKLDIRYTPVWEGKSRLADKLSRKLERIEIAQVINTGSFGILSAELIRKKKGEIYDENFLMFGSEDIDLSIMIEKEKIPYSFIDYKIGDLVGMSTGEGFQKYLRYLANYAYLNFKHPITTIRGLRMEY